MFERLTIELLTEIAAAASGSLQCLPYCRSLLDALECLGKKAYPLVIRGVVFGRQDDNSLYRTVGVERLVRSALASPQANAAFDLPVDVPSGNRLVRFPFRTIGLPDQSSQGDKTLGNYDASGRWLGHLAVIVEGTLIDPTIGQLNDPSFNIDFNPPALTVAASESFLKGETPLVFLTGGKLVAYEAYPDERTHEASKSWTDPTFRAELKDIGARTAKLFGGQDDSELHDPSPAAQ